MFDAVFVMSCAASAQVTLVCLVRPSGCRVCLAHGRQCFSLTGSWQSTPSLQRVSGVIPASYSDGKAGQEKQDSNDKASSSGMSLGSDALALPWYTGQASLDMPLYCNLACMALAVLHRMKRYHTVVQVICLRLSLPVSMHYTSAPDRMTSNANIHWLQQSITQNSMNR